MKYSKINYEEEQMRNASKLLLTMLVVSLVCMAGAALVVSCPDPEPEPWVPGSGTNPNSNTGTNDNQTGTNTPGGQTGTNTPQPPQGMGQITDWHEGSWEGSLLVELGTSPSGDPAYKMSWTTRMSQYGAGNGGMWANIPTDINLGDYTHIICSVENSEGLAQDINILLRGADGIEGPTWRLNDGSSSTATGWFLSAAGVTNIEADFETAHIPDWNPPAPPPIPSWTAPKALWILNIANAGTAGGSGGTTVGGNYVTYISKIGFFNANTYDEIIVWNGDR